MWRFGIYADRDSVFIGGKPGRWVGVHLDLPWSECCRAFGAPYALYLHWWPGRCKTIFLRILSDRREDLFTGSGSRRVRVVKRCAVCGLEGDIVHMVYKVDASIRNPNGIEKDLGMSYFSLCPHDAALANMHRLRVKLVE